MPFLFCSLAVKIVAYMKINRADLAEKTLTKLKSMLVIFKMIIINKTDVQITKLYIVNILIDFVSANYIVFFQI